MLIFTSHDTPRFRYAANALFSALGVECVFTTDEKEFMAFTGPRIAYGQNQVDGAIQVPAVAVALWQGPAQPHEISRGNWQGVPSLYTGHGTVPFDVFGAVFFLLSRYEEYWPFEGDKMGRFSSGNSVVGDASFLQRPVIDEWRILLCELIQQRWPNSDMVLPAYQFVSTVDIDSAFAYIGKGMVRTVLAMAKDVVRRDWNNLKERWAALLATKADKYDTYAYMHDALQCCGAHHMYFVQLSDWSEHDRNVHHSSKTLRQKIKELHQKYAVGMHPGVRSHGSKAVLEEEKTRLENIISEAVRHSRQHYLMLKFPQTYRALLEIGITDDYTMGYADQVGFRAGTSRPFAWYDVLEDKETPLIVHPIAMMDTTMRKYMKLSPQEATTLGREIIQRIRQSNGQCLILWHNESFSEADGWQGWRPVWEDQLAHGQNA